MRILHVVHGFPPYDRAGAEYYTYYLAMNQKEGNDVFVFARRGDRDNKEYTVTDEEQYGVKIRRVVNNFTNANKFLDYYLNDEIEEIFSEYLKEVKPDIVHFQHLIGLTASLPYIARKAGCATVLTLHDYWYICPRIQLIDARDEICEGPQEGYRCAKVCSGHYVAPPEAIAGTSLWRFLKRVTPQPVQRFIKYNMLGGHKNTEPGAGDLPESDGTHSSKPRRTWNPPDGVLTHKIQNYSFRVAYLRSVMKSVDLLIAPSDFVREKHIELGVDGSKIKRIYHGTVPGCLRGIKKEPSDKLRIVYLGTLLKHKGIDVLIRAFNKLPHDMAQLRVYGYGDENESATLKHLKGLIKAEGVSFMGGYANEQLPDMLANADVVVVPSKWYETFNIVAREALISGTPVIASNAGALPEAITDGVNGLLFDCGDPVELSAKIMRILEEPGLLESLSKGASATEIKGMTVHEAELLDIYGSLIKR